MQSQETWAEVFEFRIKKLSFSPIEIEKLISHFELEKRKYRKFDFKKQGLKMTAVEFLKTQAAIKRILVNLKKRRKEILKNGN